MNTRLITRKKIEELRAQADELEKELNSGYADRPLSDKRLTREYYRVSGIVFKDSAITLGDAVIHMVEVRHREHPGKVGRGVQIKDSTQHYATEMACRDLESQL